MTSGVCRTLCQTTPAHSSKACNAMIEGRNGFHSLSSAVGTVVVDIDDLPAEPVKRLRDPSDERLHIGPLVEDRHNDGDLETRRRAGLDVIRSFGVSERGVQVCRIRETIVLRWRSTNLVNIVIVKSTHMGRGRIAASIVSLNATA